MKKNQATKAKEPVRLRFRELKDGSKSIYLDIYYNGVRKYEFLKMYLVPEKNITDKEQNRRILEAADTIKSRRIIELHTNVAGIPAQRSDKWMTLDEWLDKVIDYKAVTVEPQTHAGFCQVARLLRLFGAQVALPAIDRRYFQSFTHFLQTEYCYSRNGSRPRRLSHSSVYIYVKLFSTIMNMAQREGLISSNPFYRIDPKERPHKDGSTREFLTIDEVKRLELTPFPQDHIRRAFLFSCFCGLRWSDIRRLTWGNIQHCEGGAMLIMTMQKTQNPIYLPLNNKALSVLPERWKIDDDSDIIFKRLPSNCEANRRLREWTAAAGITKKVTFHVARHTFATTSLTLGADIYTTSKLLGHSSITTTQVYARIINEKKEQAVALFDAVF